MDWTPSQQAVLDDPSRVRVVRAGPGSGKTQVFIEAFRRYLDEHQGRGGGVAALSFTNAATHEIAERLGRTLAPPHFVGTLDSFMFRFVIRPFGELVGVNTKGARLIPAELVRYHPTPEIKVGPAPGDRVSAFEVHASGGSTAAPTFTFQSTYRGLSALPADLGGQAYRVKLKEWAVNGRVSHSDCQYIAAKILADPHYGPIVLARLARRFPVILVDEFQDTGHFLSMALSAMLAQPSVHALLVGDPDQAIYEFGGANPALFPNAERLPGATPLALPESHRCPARVAGVASALSTSGAQVVPLAAREEGAAVLIRHRLEQPAPDPNFIAQVTALVGPEDRFALLARRSKTVHLLVEQGQARVPDGCPIARRLDAASLLAYRGDVQGAVKQVAGVLGDLALQRPDPTRTQLLDAGLCPKRWRKAKFHLFVAAARLVPGETWGDWLLRLKTATGEALRSLGLPIRDADLGPRFRRSGPAWGMSREAPKAPDVGWPAGTVARTVHKVKGAEFEAVAFFIPKPHARHAACPSVEWWGERLEERRIAFVAASRAKRIFMLAVHHETYVALETRQPAFLELFDAVYDLS